MDLNGFFLLFPSIFILHELEEILLFPRFMRRNPKLQQQFLAATFTPFRFNAIVCQEFILLLVILGLSIYFESFDFYITIIIAYVYHVIGHIFQSIFLRQYIRVSSAALSQPDIAHIRYMMRCRQTICN